MKNVINEMEVIINSQNPISTWREISHACKEGTMKFIIEYDIDIRNKESIFYDHKFIFSVDNFAHGINSIFNM